MVLTSALCEYGKRKSISEIASIRDSFDADRFKSSDYELKEWLEKNK
jgi:hypothetical protein